MGTDYYCVNKEKKIAFYVGRTDFEDLAELSPLYDLVEYMNNEENVKLNVIGYFWSRINFPTYKGIFASMLIEDYGFELVSEENISLKEFIVFYNF